MSRVPGTLHDLDLGKDAKASTTATTKTSNLSAPSTSSPHQAIPKTSEGHGNASGSNASENGKVGIVDKVKGEVKVISGKLGGNERKIEEGRQLMGKA